MQTWKAICIHKRPKFVSCHKKGLCVFYCRDSQLRVTTTLFLGTSNPSWTKEKAVKRTSLLKGIKSCGTASPAAAFHRQTQTVIPSQGKVIEDWLMLLDITSNSHKWFPNCTDGLAPPYSVSILMLLELSDVCGMAHWGDTLSLS